MALLLVLRACEPFDVARSSRHAELAERRRLEVALGADFSRAACSAAVDTEHSAAASKLSTMCRKRERAAALIEHRAQRQKLGLVDDYAPVPAPAVCRRHCLDEERHGRLNRQAAKGSDGALHFKAPSRPNQPFLDASG